MLQGEIDAMKEHAESRAAEIRRLQATVESYKLSNDELNVSAGVRSLRNIADCLTRRSLIAPPFQLSGSCPSAHPSRSRSRSLRHCHFTSQRALTIASAGSQDGESFANSAKEAERLRKAMEIQHAEFELSKKSLVKDLQNRCEKVSCPLRLVPCHFVGDHWTGRN